MTEIKGLINSAITLLSEIDGDRETYENFHLLSGAIGELEGANQMLWEEHWEKLNESHD